MKMKEASMQELKDTVGGSALLVFEIVAGTASIIGLGMYVWDELDEGWNDYQNGPK